MSMESIYEYGSRVGVWRVLELFSRYEMPFTVYGVAMAMERNPAAVDGAAQGRATRSRATAGAGSTTRTVPSGSSASTCGARSRSTAGLPASVRSAGTPGAPARIRASSWSRTAGFVYDADDYSDDLPWYDTRYRDKSGKPQLVVPYTLDANDMRFRHPPGIQLGRPVLRLPQGRLRRPLRGRQPRAAHDVGRACTAGSSAGPGGSASLERFLKHVRGKKVWIARRIDIARHWLKHHPYE
jgi:peptidoglycan/xylan/chitin deacetylase (PgdA/CDA1 family)